PPGSASWPRHDPPSREGHEPTTNTTFFDPTRCAGTKGRITMPFSVNSFLDVEGANAAARLRVTDDGQGVVAYGKSPKGRVVAWLKEVFGDGEAENQKAIRGFCAAVRSEYGDRAYDAVTQQLQARFAGGKPLSMRHVQQAVGMAKAIRNAAVA